MYVLEHWMINRTNKNREAPRRLHSYLLLLNFITLPLRMFITKSFESFQTFKVKVLRLYWFQPLKFDTGVAPGNLAVAPLALPCYYLVYLMLVHIIYIIPLSPTELFKLSPFSDSLRKYHPLYYSIHSLTSLK